MFFWVVTSCNSVSRYQRLEGVMSVPKGHSCALLCRQATGKVCRRWEEDGIQYRQVEMFALCEGTKRLCHWRVFREVVNENYGAGQF